MYRPPPRNLKSEDGAGPTFSVLDFFLHLRTWGAAPHFACYALAFGCAFGDYLYRKRSRKEGEYGT